MKKTEEHTIDEDVYTATQLGAVQGKQLYDKLLKAIGPALREVIMTIGKDDSAGADLRAAAMIIGALESLPLELLNDLDTKFAASCQVRINGITMPLGPVVEDGVFDQHFAGRFDSMMKWRMMMLKLNFGSFLAKWVSSAKQGAAQIQSP